MSLALAPELKCACGAGVEPTEEGRCAHCRMIERGDDQLLTHDSRGWLGENGERVPCQCGCGMTEVPVMRDLHIAPEPEPQLDDAALSRLVGLLDDAGQTLEVTFRHEIPEHSQRLLKTLGATYTIAADAPPCASACGHPECREDTMQEPVKVAEVERAWERIDGRKLPKDEPVPSASEPSRPRSRANPFTREEGIAAIQAFAAEHGRPPGSAEWSKGKYAPSTAPLVRLFGSWSAAIEAAGFPRPGRGARAHRRTGSERRLAEPLTQAPAPLPDPEPAPPANGDLRAAGLSLIASVRVFLDALEKEIA